MAIEKQPRPYFILWRFNPDGTQRTIMRQDLECLVDTDTGAVLHEVREMDARDATNEDLAPLLPDVTAKLAAQVQTLKSEAADKDRRIGELSRTISVLEGEIEARERKLREAQAARASMSGKR